MNKSIHMFVVFLVFATLAAACGSAVQSTNEPSSVDQLGTVVASTMQALTPNSVDPSPAPGGNTPVPSLNLLPRSLHFINNDDAGIAQVFRLETDGETIQQITAEPVAVRSYDVSQVDGSVVYVANNQLLLINADGSGRHMLVDGGSIDENNPFVSTVSNPVFSPN